MGANSFPILGVNPLIDGLELEQILYNYKKEMSSLHNKYSDYFSKLSKVRATMNIGQKVETLLAIRFALGLKLDRIVMEKNEVDFLDELNEQEKTSSTKQEKATKVSLQLEDKEDSSESENGVEPEITEEQKEKYNRMYLISTILLSDMIQKIDKARHDFFKDTNEPRDISKMLDVFIEIKYKEKVLELAGMLAQTMRESGKAYTEEQFQTALTTSKPYTQLAELYEEVSTQDKRNMLIPEHFVNSSMSNSHELKIGNPKRIEQLLKREEKHELEYMQNVRRIKKDPSLMEKEKIAVNQNHDYSWGIVLQKPQYMLLNEPVDTPIFKGHITVENIGSFSELSLFRKRKFEYEKKKDISPKGDIRRKQETFSRLRMKRNEVSTENRTMRSYLYKHEASKVLADNLLKVTKVDTDGRISKRIIISPVQYTGREGSEYKEFLKNVYFSDYVLDVAASNGGYAGRIEHNPNGFFVSNKYNEDEISSAYLFATGKAGTILDNRDRNNRVRYVDATSSTLLELLNSRGRERNFNE